MISHFFFGIEVKCAIILNILLGEARSGWHSFITGLIKERIKTFPVQKISTAPYWSGADIQEGQNAPVFDS
jgi:hypothetical protein